MKILVDEEGKNHIEAVCDVALKAKGNLIINLVTKIYAAIEVDVQKIKDIKPTEEG